MDTIDIVAKADSSNVDLSSYSLNYIDNDDIPELYIWDGKTFQSLYSYNNEAVLCKELSYRGTIWALNGSGYFWTADSSNAAYQYYDFHKLEGGSCDTVYSFCIDRSDMPVEKYLINDEEVSKEEYESKMAECEAECPLSDEYMINYIINETYSYDEIMQYLLDSSESSDSVEVEEDNNGEQNTRSSEISSKNVPATETVSKVERKSKSPDTSDKGIAYAFIGVAVSAVAAVAFKKRKS